jgi:hypothetical protein
MRGGQRTATCGKGVSKARKGGLNNTECSIAASLCRTTPEARGRVGMVRSTSVAVGASGEAMGDTATQHSSISMVGATGAASAGVASAGVASSSVGVGAALGSTDLRREALAGVKLTSSSSSSSFPSSFASS